MKNYKFWAIILVSLSLGTGFLWSQSRKGQATKEFMREKLEHSQRILEGITLEDYDLVIAKSQKLSAMSQAATWQVFNNPDYAQHSTDFRKSVEALTRAAERKNIDAATLAYVRVTMNCVECHKFVRGKMVAGLSVESSTTVARSSPGSR